MASLDGKLQAKLQTLESRMDELSAMLAEPDATADMERYTRLSRAYAELEPVVQQYRRHTAAEAELAGARELAETTDDPEIRAMAVEEVKELEERLKESVHELQLMLLTDDPNDARNVVLEIRAGAGGDEASLFLARCWHGTERELKCGIDQC